MRRVWTLLLFAPMALAVSGLALGQGLAPQGGGRGLGRGGGVGAPQSPPPPAPRGPDGRVHLGPPEGETGLWVGRGGLSVTSHEEVPYQSWARDLAQHRRESMLEPHARCKPSGGPRQWLTPYGAEIVEMPDLERIFIFDIGGPHTYRIIYMDGREHPDDIPPSYYGHSVGRWEGDTLVIDSVGYSERFWIDRGQSPHTEDLRMIERLTRTDRDTLTYEITIEDPNVYTEPWTAELGVRWIRNEELFEYVCQDNNYAMEIMVGLEGDNPNRSRIVP